MTSTGQQLSRNLLACGRPVLSAVTAVGILHGLSLSAQQPSNASPQPGTPGSSPESTMTAAPAQGNRARISTFVSYDYVGQGDAKFQGNKRGDSDAHSVNAGVSAELPVNDRWFVPVGLGTANHFLESPTGVPIPDQINTLRLHTGLGYHLNDQWVLLANVGPVLYRFDDVSSHDIGFSGMLSARYQMQPGLTLAFGLVIHPDRDVPVLPVAGVRWDIQTNLTLNLMYPRPALLYRVAPKWTLFVGGEVKMSVFRADDDMGDKIGQSEYNNALGTYRDFHIGVGAEYEIIRRLSVTVEGGYSVGREIDYTRIDEKVKFDPSPYAQVGLRYRF